MKNTIIVISLFFLVGCQTTYKVKSGEAFPTFDNPPKLGEVAGVMISDESTKAKAASITLTDIGTLFADRLREEGIFETVVYPYTEHAQVSPDVLLNLIVNSEDDQNMAENMGKAAAVGASLFVLSPVLPIRFEIKLDMTAQAEDQAGGEIGEYSYGDIYELKYTTLMPSKGVMEEWVEQATRHLVDNVIEEILLDADKFSPQGEAVEK